MVTVNYDALSTALEFVSSGMLTEHRAYISIDTGVIYWVADSSDIDDDAPEGLEESDRYIAVPSIRHRLILARNVLTGESKRFVSNAAPSVPLGTLLRVAFTRWAVERCFQDAKGELGMSHFEVRTYQSLMRHMILTAVSFLFLARALKKRRGEKPAPDDLPAPAGDGHADRRELAWIA